MNSVSIINKINVVYGVIIAVLSYILGEHWILFVGYFVLNFGDLVSRWIAARIAGIESSKKCSIGIIKKLGYWLIIMVAFGMSALFVEFGNTLGIDLHVTSMIGYFVLCALIINEFRSILENLVEAGYNVPNVLVKGLEIVNKAIDGKIKISEEGVILDTHLTDDELSGKVKTTFQVEDIRQKSGGGSLCKKGEG